MKKPNFIIIGPGKSGTTWAFNALDAHHDVCMSTAKETMFFNEYYHKGFDWYLSFFLHCNGQKKIGEVTNTYISSEKVPKRMFEFNPDLQLIALLRNPVDRAFSNYLFFLRNGAKFSSFEQAIEKRPDLLDYGKYFYYLNQYIQYFPKEQINIMFFDDLQKDSYSFGENLFLVLGLDSCDAAIQIANNNILPASSARSIFISKLVKFFALKVRDYGRPDLVTKIKHSYIRHLLYRPYRSYPSMRNETRKKLQEFYYEDVLKLSKLTNRDLLNQWFGL